MHCENRVIEPGETVDLRQHGLKGFITAHKEIVTILINGDPYPIERGERTVTEILGKLARLPMATSCWRRRRDRRCHSRPMCQSKSSDAKCSTPNLSPVGLRRGEKPWPIPRNRLTS